MRFVKLYFLTQKPFVALRSNRNVMELLKVGTFLTVFLSLLLAGTALAQTNLTTLYSFHLIQGDGANPIGDLSMDSQGAFYGVTLPQGGGGGTIYQLTPPAFGTSSWTKTVLYRGSNAAGGPVRGRFGPVILGKNGELYGTSDTCAGSPLFYGCVFQLVNSGGTWTMHILHAFQGTAAGDGKGVARAKLAMDVNGKLYGVTGSGGLANTATAGTVYQLTPPATPGGVWTEQVLYKFQHGLGGFYRPENGVVIDQKGALYGTTRNGVAPHKHGTQGVIYQMTPPAIPGGSWTINVINNTVGGGFFQGMSGLTMAPSGAIYGVGRFVGGAFELAPPTVPGGAWTLSHLPSNIGGGPGSELLRDTNGALYGTDRFSQLAYKLTPPTTPGGAWTYSLLHTFIGGSEGSRPFGRLAVDSSGHVFGTTIHGGTGPCGGGQPGCGTVFELQ